MDAMKFISPSYEVLLDICHEFTKPGMPGLGGPGWVQPKNDDFCKWGEVYANVNTTVTMQDVLINEVYAGWGKETKELSCGLDAAKEILRQYPRYNGRYEAKYTLDAILEDEIFAPYKEIESDLKPFYRLTVMIINCYLGETHNFACEFTNYLAVQYTGKLELQVYENVNPNTENLLNFMLDNGLEDKLEYSILEEEFPNSPCYDETIYQWLQENYNQHSADFLRLIEHATGVKLKDSYFDFEDEFLQFLAAIMAGLRDAILDGGFVMRPDDSIDGKYLMAYLQECAASQVLPGFENI